MKLEGAQPDEDYEVECEADVSKNLAQVAGEEEAAASKYKEEAQRHQHQRPGREGWCYDERPDQGERDEVQERQEAANNRANFLRWLHGVDRRQQVREQPGQWQRSSWWSEWEWR